MNKKYIFGSGISALIFKYHNPEYTIISPDLDVGGQLTKHKNMLLTFYIHNTKETKELLDELKIEYKEKRLRIYYKYNDKIVEILNKKQRIKFIKNKTSEYNYDSNSIDIEDSNLSTQSNYLDILNCDVYKLIEALTPDESIFGIIKLVNNNRKFFIMQDKDKKLHKLKYDKIVSTIPANLFFNMLYNYKSEYDFNYLPATYVLSEDRPDFFTDEESMYYICNNNLIYNRIHKNCNGYIYEITGMIEEKEIAKHIKNIKAVEYRYVGIIKSDNVDDFKHIKFIGRMAEWNHSLKVQDVIKKSIKIRDMEKKYEM